MKKIISVAILILCICTSLIGCTNSKSVVETATPVITPEPTQAPTSTAAANAADQHMLASYNIIVPILNIEYNDQTYRALTGVTSWSAYLGNFSKSLDNSALPPEMLVENQERPILTTEDGYLNLVFSTKPFKYEVVIWNSEDYAASEIIEISEDNIPVSKDSPFTIYQVKAEFYSLVDGLYEEGEVYYCFAINENLD